MQAMVKWLAGLAVTLAVIGGLGWVIYDRVTEAMQPPQGRGGGEAAVAVAVEVAPVRVGTIRDIRHFTGSLRARSQYEVAPQIAGRLERLAVDIGDTVEHGEVVAWLDDQEFVQQVEQARAELRVAEATLEEKRSRIAIAQREFNRVQRLREQQIASASELDEAQSRLQAEQAALAVAEAQLAQRAAALRAAEVRLSYTRIRATWDNGRGPRIVGERFVDASTTLSANTPIISVIDIDTVIAVLHVTERDYTELAVGQEATVRLTANRLGDEAPDAGTFTGRIVRMAPRFDEGSRQARVEIAIENPDHPLKPGMFVRVSLNLNEATEATIVPRQALVRREGVQGVFVAERESREARFVPVRLGVREGDRVQVLEPALSGAVVTLGQHLISDGTRLAIAEDPDAPGDESATAEVDADAPVDTDVNADADAAGPAPAQVEATR